MFIDFVFIAVLILANGFFAAAEMAVISARQVRLQALAEGGNKRAQKTLRLRENPAEFLATVQVGITLVATLASAGITRGVSSLSLYGSRAHQHQTQNHGGPR